MRLSNCLRLIVVLLLAGMLSGFTPPPLSTAAVDSTGKVAGVLLDANDARITEARISIENAETNRRVKSGPDGEFEASLPVGDYRITFEADGFQKFSLGEVTIKADQTLRIRIHLLVADPHELVPASPK